MAREYLFRSRVQWVDTDASGRIHFTAVFRWAEAAEHGLGRELGLSWKATNLPRRHVEADYQRALEYDDEFELRLRAEKLGRTSIDYAWRIECRGELCVAGRHTVVHVGDDGRPAPLPDEVRTRLTSGSS
jgi:YbgC/YbaW family acyl-CoA thioester hydrolase